MQGVRALKYSDCPLARLALVAALAAALGLTACGRKGPLDPPPAASVTGEQTVTTGDEPRTPNRPILGPDGKPIAPGLTNKRIPLDVLLN
jgi:predicted small lipoprotein YifL